MYDIRQFRPTLYLLVWLGFLGYAMAAASPAFFVIPTLLLALNAWLVATKRFSALPRWMANGITLVGLAWAFTQSFGSRQNTILVIGQFLIFLQIVKLFEQRANRDYAQLLVLSLLLMVAASINTASLLFGLLLIVYLFISLYCCLLFHLKVETELARSNMALPDSPRSENTLRQDQHDLSKSMRRVATLIASASVVSAIVVFLLFPRGLGEGVLGQVDFRAAAPMTGFSEQSGFERLAKITQSNEIAAWVSVKKNGVPVSGAEPLLLRGITFDVYNGDDKDAGEWMWARSHSLLQVDGGASSGGGMWQSNRHGPGKDVYEQKVTLEANGACSLFAMAGAYQVKVESNPEVDLGLHQGQADELLLTGSPINQQCIYTVYSRGYLESRWIPTEGALDLLRDVFRHSRQMASDDDSDGFDRGRRRRQFSNIDPAIAAYALRPEVTDGLAAKRPRSVAVSPLDEGIARAIEHHLQTNFTYTLDLSNEKLREGQDPVAWFLSDAGHRGHCEFFASAMTLMCQSLGMQARRVDGFKCDEYNQLGKYYTVRMSHAHAWVEVLTSNGWQTFDPTSGREAPGETAAVTLWQSAKQLFNFMEFTWAKNVVAYGNEDRRNLLTDINFKLTRSAEHGNSVLQATRTWLALGGNWVISSALLTALMGLMALVLISAITYFFIEKIRLRRRAARIGLDGLSVSDQLELAKQLGFYDDLLLLLEKHQIVRPAHLTPQEFADSLAHLPAEVFATVRRLTAIFYLIRYGRRQLTPPRQRRLVTVIEKLASVLQPPAPVKV